MKSIIQTNVERRVEKEAKKKTLIDSYGNLIGWMKLLADWLLAPVGAILDGLVLFGIFYLAVKSLPLAIALAAAFAIFLQFMYGSPAAHAASTVFSGRYQEEGEQTMMWAMFVFTIAALGGSLYLSFNSDKLVEAIGEQYYIQESDTTVNNRYDNMLADAQQQYNTDVAALNERINGLQNDKIMWEGKETVRWNSSKRAGQLSEQITTLQHDYNNRVQQIEQQRNNSLQQLQQRNTTTANMFSTRIENGGAALMFFNVAFNIGRVLIIITFIYFAVKASAQLKQPPTPVATTVGASNTTQQQRVPTQSFAPAAAQQPAPDRTVVKPFGSPLPRMAGNTAQQHAPQQPPTPVATTVGSSNTTQGSNTYNVTVVDGEPTLPPPAMMNTKATGFTLEDVKRRIPTYAKRGSEKAKEIHRELLNMEAILTQEKGIV